MTDMEPTRGGADLLRRLRRGLRRTARALGLTWQRRRDDPENHQTWHKGRWHVSLSIRPVGAKGREYDTAIPHDLTEVSLLYRG